MLPAGLAGPGTGWASAKRESKHEEKGVESWASPAGELELAAYCDNAPA